MPLTVYCVRTRAGYRQLASRLPAWPPQALWLAPGVLTPAEVAALRASGADVTVFTRPITDERLARQLIEDHYPSAPIWIEPPSA